MQDSVECIFYNVTCRQKKIVIVYYIINIHITRKKNTCGVVLLIVRKIAEILEM